MLDVCSQCQQEGHLTPKWYRYNSTAE